MFQFSCISSHRTSRFSFTSRCQSFSCPDFRIALLSHRFLPPRRLSVHSGTIGFRRAFALSAPPAFSAVFLFICMVGASENRIDLVRSDPHFFRSAAALSIRGARTQLRDRIHPPFSIGIAQAAFQMHVIFDLIPVDDKSRSVRTENRSARVCQIRIRIIPGCRNDFFFIVARSVAIERADHLSQSARVRRHLRLISIECRYRGTSG